MKRPLRTITGLGLLAAAALLVADVTPARAQLGGNGITFGQPGGFNVTIGNGYSGYGNGYSGYGNYGPGYNNGMVNGYSPHGYNNGYSPYGYNAAPGVVNYGRGYSHYGAPGYNAAPGYNTTSYQIAPGVRYNTSGYSYPQHGYSNYGYSNYPPRVYYRR